MRCLTVFGQWKAGQAVEGQINDIFVRGFLKWQECPVTNTIKHTPSLEIGLMGRICSYGSKKATYGSNDVAEVKKLMYCHLSSLHLIKYTCIFTWRYSVIYHCICWNWWISFNTDKEDIKIPLKTVQHPFTLNPDNNTFSMKPHKPSFYMSQVIWRGKIQQKRAVTQISAFTCAEITSFLWIPRTGTIYTVLSNFTSNNPNSCSLKSPVNI